MKKPGAKKSTGGRRPGPMKKGAWEKSPPELVALFEKVFPGPPAEQRQMFGYPAAFVNGNMFMGLFQDRFFVRLSEEERAKFLATPGAGIFEPMPGRPMKEYVVVPPSLRSDPRKLTKLMEKSLEYGRSFPSKPKRSRKR